MPEGRKERDCRHDDSRDNSAARKVGEGRYEFLEAGIIPPPSEGAWVSTWEPGPSTEKDVRRRIPKE